MAFQNLLVTTPTEQLWSKHRLCAQHTWHLTFHAAPDRHGSQQEACGAAGPGEAALHKLRGTIVFVRKDRSSQMHLDANREHWENGGWRDHPRGSPRNEEPP